MSDDPAVELPVEGEAGPAPAHALSLVVWDTPSPAALGAEVRVKIGAHCDCGCDLNGERVAVTGAGGAPVGEGFLDQIDETDGARLHWTTLGLAPPAAVGVAAFTAFCSGETLAGEHAPAEQSFSFPVDRPPAHRVTVRVVREATGEPCADVEVRLGRYEAYTNEDGLAVLHVPGGAYLATLRRFGLKAAPVELVVDGDLVVELAAQKGETREELEARLSQMENQPWA